MIYMKIIYYKRPELTNEKIPIDNSNNIIPIISFGLDIASSKLASGSEF